MMQFHQQRQSSSLLTSNLSSQLPIVDSNSQRSTCQSFNMLSSTPVMTMSRAKVAHSSSSFFSRRSIVCRPVLFSAFAWSVVLLFILSSFGVADAGSIFMGHPLGKRSYLDLGCKGVYDKSIFARLDRVCEDCYNLFREPQIHSLCRKDCFTSYYFKGCVETLLMADEMDEFKQAIKQLHGADPGV